MRAAASRMEILERLKRRIDAMASPQVVIIDPHGRPDHFSAHGARHQAMLQSAQWAPRIKGVFMPGVSVAELGRALFHD